MRPRALPRRRTAPGVLAAIVALGSGALSCDVVQGFKHAGDALFPPVKTYLDAPGYRLVEGGYRDLVLLTSSELFVLARSAKDNDNSLYSIRYAVPEPCTIPEVGRYWAGGSIDVGQAWIAFLHDGSQSGTLSFSDTGCHVSTLTLPDAELPYARITPRDANGDAQTDRLLLLVHSERKLLLVDPSSPADPEVLIDPADGWLSGVGKPNVNIVLSDGKLVVFDADWNYLTTFGDGIKELKPLGDSVYFVDVNGLQRATPNTQGGVIGVDIEVLAADGCNIAFPSPPRHWVGFFSPCVGDDDNEKALTLYDESTKELSHPELQVEDTGELLLLPDPNATGTPKPNNLDELWAFYLRDIGNYGMGTLFARPPGGDELMLGENAVLDRLTLDKSGAFGLALVDVDPNSAAIGTYERWEPDGTLTALADNVLREGTGQSWADVMIDWDGTSGTLAQVNGGALYPLMERVPRRGFAYQDVHKRQALFNDYDGENGTLSIGELACAPGTTHCERQYYVPRVVARGVHHPSHAFLDDTEDFLPGIGFLDEYDVERGTGRFQYRNLELGFTSIVSEGVSDFVFAGNGMLYAVPFGAGAGIWLTRAK